MIEFFKSIVDVVTSLLHFAVHTVTSLIALITRIPTYISFLISSISFMPEIVYPFIVASLSVLVVLLIVNRGH